MPPLDGAAIQLLAVLLLASLSDDADFSALGIGGAYFAGKLCKSNGGMANHTNDFYGSPNGEFRTRVLPLFYIAGHLPQPGTWILSTFCRSAGSFLIFGTRLIGGNPASFDCIDCCVSGYLARVMATIGNIDL